MCVGGGGGQRDWYGAVTDRQSMRWGIYRQEVCGGGGRETGMGQ